MDAHADSSGYTGLEAPTDARRAADTHTMSTLVDRLIALYFASHFVLGYLIDAQSILPDVAPSLYQLYEDVGLVALVRWWGEQEGDFLVLTNPLWFKSFIWAEVTLQLPACAIVAVGWHRRREWVRMPALLYSVHVLTTMLPIMFVLRADPRPTLTCLLVYSVWIVLPLLSAWRCLASGEGQLFGPACVSDYKKAA